MYRLIAGLVLGMFALVAGATGNPDRGQQLTASCAACHGQDGNSPVGTFPSLAGQQPKYLLKQLLDIKRGDFSVPLMTGQLDTMTEQNLQDIAAYYASKKMHGGAAQADLAARGEVIYRAGIKRKAIAACTACHLPNGQGNNAAAFPALAGQWPEYIEKQLKAFRNGSRTNDGNTKMMRNTAQDLSDDEIAAVASYLYGLR